MASAAVTVVLNKPFSLCLQKQFEERICMVKNGAFLNSISKVEISEAQLPAGLHLSVRILTIEWFFSNFIFDTE